MKPKIPEYLIRIIRKYDENSIYPDVPKGGHQLFEEGDMLLAQYSNHKDFTLCKVKTERLVDLDYSATEKVWRTSKLLKNNLEKIDSSDH